VPVGVTAVERSRVIAAAPESVWAIIADPHHQPRWWPGVDRMESVEAGRSTQVLRTRRGRPVRVDYTICEATASPGLALWRQELEGGPFARVLSAGEVRIVLGAADGGPA
jgi:uncharacterized protein YndB with AHSA1/START domain